MSVEKWKSPVPLTRKEQVAITRLRIGHTKMTHMFLITRQPEPMCETCNVRQTVKHALVQCPQYRNQRQEHELDNTITSVLSNNEENITKLIAFLNSTELIKQII
ncbi:hypothetical protein CBL_20399 [Carabus blaptoides fortunei]